MAPLEPLAASAELCPEPEEMRRRSISSGPLSASVASLRASGAGGNRKGAGGLLASLGLGGFARRSLGITLLLVTVFLWTASNFLASYIFSDHTYDKPFFVVYINTSIFAISLIPLFVRYYMRHGMQGVRAELVELWVNEKGREYKQGGGNKRARGNSLLGQPAVLKTSDDEEHGFLSGRTEDDDDDDDDEDDDRDAEARSSTGDGATSAMQIQDAPGLEKPAADKLSLRETGLLSLEFCMLWFCANYFASACLEYTSVGSVTILTSTSSVWTLIFCAAMRVESFSARKLAGVLASLAGVVLISSVDLSGKSDEDRGSFPHKSQASIAVGDGMAFFSAIVYGLYVTVMKRRVGDEDRVNMPLFFGLVGLLNLVFLWPGFFILHWTGIEPFGWPPTGKVWAIILLNSLSSFVSDISWAFAMLLTSPLVVTVGLSLTIPLSLIGEMIQYAQYSSWIYWVGAGIVLVSFLFINHESAEEGDKDKQTAQ
ncbi:thiamine-repressible mitochondrial transport protein thi74 [Diaporthe eres]|uniref:EamA domain-containing protein n=1 Tax=Diaporthe vaccinii TaxID=105482 RepID=A0ABR4F1U8_9PEZI|nr:thiamine-repressible mitochondrial transport protein thi74 [Diaporthe eres]